MKKGKLANRFEDLSNKPFILKFIYFFSSLFYDFAYRFKNKNDFKEFGLTLYCGRQGAGKTMAMTISIHAPVWGATLTLVP